LKMAALGYRTGILDMTRGEMGTRGTVEVRTLEAAEAARLLRVTVRENLGLPDTRVSCDDSARVAMVRALRRFRPRIVLAPYWEDPHPDHAHTSRIVREAGHLAGLAKFDPESGWERYRPAAIGYYLFPRTVTPSFIVDISEHFEGKMAAIRAHRSQFHDPGSRDPETMLSDPGFLARLEARHRYFGSLLDVAYGEPLLVREALNVEDPVALLSRSMNLYS
ncbi:MAG: bacillithiol biosynthesis deacetylase BshB1, partial [Acidobacteria bacterium]|nr:bacillithiol biosynthesis deacetylase BshB1 [Acidobacteriota bacterium]